MKDKKSSTQRDPCIAEQGKGELQKSKRKEEEERQKRWAPQERDFGQVKQELLWLVQRWCVGQGGRFLDELDFVHFWKCGGELSQLVQREALHFVYDLTQSLEGGQG